MKIYDTHTHTKFSHDSSAIPENMCESAINKGLSAITFTEHCDTDFMFDEHDIFRCLGNSIDMSKKLAEKYNGALEVYSGMEVSESFWNPARYKSVMDTYYDKIDALLCSVHLTRYPGVTYIPNSAHDYSTFSDGMINGIINAYYDDAVEMIKFIDGGNILCHITYPFRYITLKYGKKGFRPQNYIKQIKRVLSLAINKDMALEINTSNIGKFQGAFYMPDYDIVKMYRELGGRLITVGSDAHIPDDVGKDFVGALEMIKKAGFKEYCYFRKKNPVFVGL